MAASIPINSKVHDDFGDGDIWELFDEIKALEKEAGCGNGEDVCCEGCGSTNMVVEDCKYVCGDCHIVQSGVVDSGAEWRFYGSEDSRGDDPNRVGLPTNDLLPKSSLGTMIGGRRYENRNVMKIRQYQIWNAMPYWERSLCDIFEKLASPAARAGIPAKVIDDAKVMYKRVSEKRISRGENREGLIASSVYYACLINKIGRSTAEIASMFNIDTTTLTKGNARFQTMLKLNVRSSGAEDFIGRFGSNLNLDYKDIDTCRAIAKRLEELELLTDNAPTSMAAGTIYFFCISKGIKVMKKDVSSACGVSDPTITKCYKKLIGFKELILEGIEL